MSMLLALTASIALSSEAAPAPRPRRQFDVADDLATHDPQRFRYRGTSFGFGARFYADFAGPAGHGSVFLAGTSEFGTRRARLAVELNMAPIPYLDHDFLVGLPWIGLAVGGLFGNERIRGGVFALGGYYWWGAEARLMIAPWRTARGGRHGVDLTLGWGNLTFMVLGFGYRWFPALLNHRRRSSVPAGGTLNPSATALPTPAAGAVLRPGLRLGLRAPPRLRLRRGLHARRRRPAPGSRSHAPTPRPS